MFSVKPKFRSAKVLSATLLAISLTVPALADEKDEAMAKKLTILLRSARAVISANPKMIGDPTTAGLKIEEFMDSTKKNYTKTMGTALDDDATKNLMKAIEEVASNAIGGKYKDRWTTGVEYPGKFLPARFAAEVSTQFSALSTGKYVLKLTVPNKFLVNKANQADDWETGVIDGKFLKPGWQRGQIYFEQASYKGKPAFRGIVPEYYDTTCLKCHGADEGKRIHAGKVEGKIGDVGGAISVAIIK